MASIIGHKELLRRCLCLFVFFLTNSGFANDSNLLIDEAVRLKLIEQYDSANFFVDRILNSSGIDEKTDLIIRCYYEKADIFQLKNLSDSAVIYKEMAVSRARTKLPSDHILYGYLNLLEASIIQRLIDNQEVDTAVYNDSVDYYLNLAEQLIYPSRTNNQVLWAAIMYEKGEWYFKLNKSLGAAERCYLEAVGFLKSSLSENAIRLGQLYFSISIFYRQMGDYERSLVYAHQASYIFSHPENHFFSSYLKCQEVIANNYLNMNEFQKAIHLYEEVISYQLEELSSNEANYLYLTYQNLGGALVETKDFAKALQHFQTAEKLNPGKSNFEINILATTYYNMAAALEGLGNLNQAEYYLRSSIDLSEKIKLSSPKGYYQSLRMFGEYLERQEAFDSALHYFQHILIEIHSEFDSKNYYENPTFDISDNPEDALYVVFAKARTLRKRFEKTAQVDDLKTALHLYSEAFKLLDLALGSNMLEGSLLSLFKFHDAGFSEGIEAAFQLYEVSADNIYFDLGLDFIEKRKYFLLHRAMLNSTYREFTGVPDSLVHAQSRILSEINQMKHGLKDSTLSIVERFDRRNQLLEKIEEERQVKAAIVGYKNPEKIKTQNFSSLSINEIQKSLITNDQIVLEFSESKKEFIVLIIGKTQKRLLRIQKDQDLVNSLKTYIRHISGSDGASEMTQAFAEYTTSAHQIYRDLFVPISRVISKFSGIPDEGFRFTVVPDGIISYLPFEALIQELPDLGEVNYWGLQYLNAQYTFNYVYSLNILKNQYSNLIPQTKRSVLALSYSSQKHVENLMKGRDALSDELPYSAEELNSVKRWVKQGLFFEGNDATEHRFKVNAEHFPLIHLALHGFADTIDMFNSRLIFKDTLDQYDDGRLHAYELYSLDLRKTQMVVLSACETGMGKEFTGEGLFSIARGFAYAGCPSIVMSLWKVDDKSTADLMDHFYKHLSKGMSKDKAMRLAKLDFIKKSNELSAHPTNWASFITVGNVEPLVFQKWYQQWILLLIPVLLLIPYVLYLWYFKKKPLHLRRG